MKKIIPVEIQALTHDHANMSCQRGTHRVIVVIMRLRKSQSIEIFSLN